MRVLYANHTSVVSGAERTLLDLVGALPPGVEPLVACPDGELRRALDKIGVQCTAMVGTSGSLRLHPVRSPRGIAETLASAAQLRVAARRLDADLIHANSIRASLIAAAAHAASGPPVLAHLHDVLPAGRLGSVIARALAASSSTVLANSSYTAADFERKAPGRVRVEVVDNPVDLDRFDPARIDRDTARARLRLPIGLPLTGVVAQLTPWKGQSDAIRALAVTRRQHPQLKLVIAGAAKFVNAGTRYDNQRYARSLRTLTRDLGVEDAVIFSGEIEDVPALMTALDLVLVPSWEEPFGRVVIEAMAMRTPVIATNVGGPAGIITDGVDGLLLAPRTPELWGARMTRLLDQPERMTAMGNAARDAVAPHYDLRAFTRSMVKTYESALIRPARRTPW